MNTTLNELKRLDVNEPVVYDKSQKDTIKNIVNKLSESDNCGYQYKMSVTRNGVKVTRIVPESLSGRANYAKTISKSKLKTTLKDNDYNKTKTAETLGLSRRTIGRMMQSYNLN